MGEPSVSQVVGATLAALGVDTVFGLMPLTGALVVVAPLKLVDGTGSPARVLAFVPR